MSNLIGSLRGLSEGTVDASAVQENFVTDADIAEFENDQQFMDECYRAALPLIIEDMLLGETADTLDENVKEAVMRIQNYLVQQGVMTEAATIRITNPKVNVVHLSKQAQIRRLKTIITLKMGRKAKHRAYKKYKLGQKIKMTNRGILDQAFGAKAERLAKKMWQKIYKNKKTAAVVADTGGKKK